MFALRRAALRVVTRPTWQCIAVSPVSRASLIRIPNKPVITRAFHQSRSWLAEEERKTSAEAVTETTEEIIEPGVQAVKEENVSTSQSADKAAEISVAPESTSRSSGLEAAQPELKSLYVGNLLFDVTSAQLQAEFGRHGEVLSCRIITDPQGTSKGYGFIEFATHEQADAARQALDSTVFQGRRLAVQLNRTGPRKSSAARTSRAANPPSDTLFIGNMSYQMSDRDLNELFRDVRDVLDVRVAIDRRTGQPRGFAHADFVDVEAAQRAKTYLENKVIYGRQLKLDYGRPASENTRQRDER